MDRRLRNSLAITGAALAGVLLAAAPLGAQGAQTTTVPVVTPTRGATVPAFLPPPAIQAPVVSPLLGKVIPRRGAHRNPKMIPAGLPGAGSPVNRLPPNPNVLKELPADAPPSPGRVQTPVTGGSWTSLSGPASGFCNPSLMTDGTVLLHICQTQTWYKLTPDSAGNYQTGAFTRVGDMPAGYGPQYPASATLPDGRFIVMGGEYNIGCNQGAWTSLGAIFDPNTNIWTNVNPPTGAGWTNTGACGSVVGGGIGDAQSIVLPNGKYMLAAAVAFPSVNALFNPSNLTWTATGAPSAYQDEAGYWALQDDRVMMVHTFAGTTPTSNPATTYNQTTETWSAIASAPVRLVDDVCGTYEIGPGLTRADGTVVVFGGITQCASQPAATNPTAIYTPSSNTWVQGPTIPSTCGTNGTTACTLADAPAVVLPNGNVLFAASEGFGANPPTKFFEFTTANSIVQVSDPLFNANTASAYYYNFLQLPNGQILVTDFSSRVQFYTPTGTPNAGWAPVVTGSSFPSTLVAGATYTLSGTQLSGVTSGGYGDDNQSFTNFPLVKITHTGSGHVYYARTFGHSNVSIKPGVAGTTNFTMPEGVLAGPSTLQVVASGIASTAVNVVVQPTLYSKAPDFNGDAKADIVWRNRTNGSFSVWEMSNGTPTGVSPPAVSKDWTIVAYGDFDGDGKTDILLRKYDGTLAMWLMNADGTIKSSAGLGALDNNWTVVGAGTFYTGDSKADIVLRHTDGRVAIWRMNGGTIVSGVLVGGVDSTWAITGLADFDGDGTTDMLLRKSTGELVLWKMADGAIAGGTTIGTISTNYWVMGTPDVNADGKADIVWRNFTDGSIATWFMNGATLVSGAGSPGISNDWNVVGVYDIIGDGRPDVLFRFKDGTMSYWKLSTAGAIAAAGAVPGTGPADWWFAR